MAFFTGWLAKLTGSDGLAAFIGAHVKPRVMMMRKSDDSLDMLTSDGAGGARTSDATAQASLASILAGMATATLQAALNALVATPGTPTPITKSDVTDTTASTAKGILVGGAGNLVVRGVGGAVDVTIVAVAGQYVPCQVSRVMAATTATGLVGLS